MNPAQTIKVLIIDDHAMVRRGLSTFLKVRPELELVGEGSSGEEALRLCQALQPDVVLMDLKMPGMDGVMATRIITEKYPCIRIIVLTSFQEEDLIRKALGAGAISYLLKNVSAEELTKAIQSAHAGFSTLTREAMEALARPTSETTLDAPVADLTRRELEVLALMVAGLTNPDIAERLVVSRSTVKAHVSNILGKLNAANRSEAVSIALKHKLLE
ncbi:MAG: response regulator transcription factor [Anaerolineaceae bacterium]|jgi:NarL family two-component system response regulator LiaR|nr:response regulator transcription factor [Anaerolineaceae bacterium]